MITLDPAALERLRAALLVRGRPSLLPAPASRPSPLAVLSDDQRAHVERAAPMCELLFLMMAADGRQTPQERELLRGAMRAVTDGVLRTVHIDAMLAEFEQQLGEAGGEERLHAVAGRLQRDRAEAEAAYSLAVAMALADTTVTIEERELLEELGELLGLSSKRRAELVTSAVGRGIPVQAARSAQIALVGDLHGNWDEQDEQYFDASDYELVLFTGDLGSGTRENGVNIARSVARLAKPALVMPGNNDASHFLQIASELAHQRGLIEMMSLGPQELPRALRNSAGRAQLCGYSLHPLNLAGREITLLAGRPFAMGGPELSYVERLTELHGVASMRESTERLCQLVAEAPTQDLLVLSHNGPHGLGDQPTDLWGCDFKPGAYDWGDPDLAEALVHAKRLGKRVLAVIAGHMHLNTRSGEARTAQRVHDGVLYVNPARVPRICGSADGEVRHHSVLEITTTGEDMPLTVRIRDVSVVA